MVLPNTSHWSFDRFDPAGPYRERGRRIQQGEEKELEEETCLRVLVEEELKALREKQAETLEELEALKAATTTDNSEQTNPTTSTTNEQQTAKRKKTTRTWTTYRYMETVE